MTAIATLVERQSRFVMLIALPRRSPGRAGRPRAGGPDHHPPVQLRRSLTWDQGKEMAAHARFSMKTGVPVYFCDPRSPWQRGSNENTNGLLRQYFPKRTEIAHYTQERSRQRRSRTQRTPSTNPRLEVTITSTRRSVAMNP